MYRYYFNSDLFKSFFVVMYTLMFLFEILSILNSLNSVARLTWYLTVTFSIVEKLIKNAKNLPTIKMQVN